MSHDVSTSELIYARLKIDVLAGRVGDHVRLDFAELAAAYDVSTTPVREAAMRLLGEGLLEVHPKGGTRPVRLSEFRLRALLDLHATIILGAARGSTIISLESEAWESATNNEQRARLLFRGIARRAGNPETDDVVERLSDRLAPYRLHEHRVLADGQRELEALHVQAANLPVLRRLLRAYHQRRTAKAAKLVWMATSP